MHFTEHHSGEKKESFSAKKQYKKLEPTKQDMIRRMLYVFTFYAGKVSKYTYRQLQEKYFMELMSDIWTVAGKDKSCEKGSITWRDLQNIYYSKGRKNVLDFSQFLQILPTISLFFQPESQREQSLKAILYYMNAIYQSIVIRDLKQTRVIEENDEMNEDARQFIFKLVPDFYKLYKLYFTQELNNKFKEKDYFYKSFQSYLEIMKQFQVYPKLLSASQLFFIFNEVIPIHSQLLYQSRYSKQTLQQAGEYFRFSKFLQSFLSISRVALLKLKQINESQIQQWMTKHKEMLKTLFEYMETVKCINKKRKTKYSQTRFSLIIYEEYPEEQSTKKYVINDKTIQEPDSKMGFYDIFSRLNIQ